MLILQLLKYRLRKESESKQCRTLRFNTVQFSQTGIEVRRDYQTVYAKDVISAQTQCIDRRYAPDSMFIFMTTIIYR